MCRLIIVSFVFITAFSCQAQQSIEGIWNTGESNTKISISEESGFFIGKIISSDEEDVKIGNQILKEVKLVNGVGSGKLYAAKKGEWYDAALKQNGNKLDIKIKVGFVSKTLEWVKD